VTVPVERVCSHGRVHSWSIVVPAKRLAVAKTRLRPMTAALGSSAAGAHEELVLALLADTVAAALACPAVGSVLVVTDEPAAADVVRALGARTAADTPDRGLNAALEHGAVLAGGQAVAALSSDLPALGPEELSAALEEAAAAARCFVPDAHGTGTTLLTAVGTALTPRFGPDSARAHRDSGARALTGRWPGLLQDVDTESDLQAALALGAGPRTTGFAERFAGRLRTAR
jgi:2-phospho-L-lactate/phosphoenolpyruvate guanylyltransferase